MVLLLRLSPAMPFNVMNFVSGTSAVRLRDFVLGSVGMLPAIVAYVYLGAAFGSGSGADAGGGGGNKDDGGEDGSHGAGHAGCQRRRRWNAGARRGSTALVMMPRGSDPSAVRGNRGVFFLDVTHSPPPHAPTRTRRSFITMMTIPTGIL
jgi:hypothetical protein